MNEILKLAKSYQDELVTYRRHIHKNPELGMDTYKTQEFILEVLSSFGIKANKCGKSGVVATLGKKEGKCILLRGDIDALPMEEENELDFKTTNKAAHLCGHDIHATIILGIAKLLKEKEDELEGKVKLMFQPAEEIAQGAKAMIEDKLLENPKVDVAMALHVDPALEVGKVGYFTGYASASYDAYFLKIQGKGGHSSTPHLAIDPLVIANTIYNQLSILSTKEVDPFKPIAMVCGKMEGGTALNIIPDTASMDFGFRCFDTSLQEFLHERVSSIVDHSCKMLRGTYEIQHFSTPSVYNDPDFSKSIHHFIEEVISKENLEIQDKPLSGTEDFAYVSQNVPSLLAWLGAKQVVSDVWLHNPKVLFNEDSLSYGVAVMANVAINWLKENA